VSQQNLPAQQPLADQLPEQKQRLNVYTMMLILAFVAICIACTLLWFELQAYAPYPWWKTEGVTPISTSMLHSPAPFLASLPSSFV
jgi:hypothetical protein